MVRLIYQNKNISAILISLLGFTLLIFANQYENQKYISMAFSFFSGVIGSLVASIFLVKSYSENIFSGIRDKINNAMNDHDLHSFKVGLDEFSLFKNRSFLYKGNKQIYELFNLFSQQIKAYDCIQASNLFEACKIYEQCNNEKVEDLKKEYINDEIEYLLESFMRNKKACLGYKNNYGGGETANEYKEKAIRFHELINSFNDQPTIVFKCYLEILQFREKLQDKLNDSLQSKIDLITMDILCSGAYGSLGLLKKQFPWHDEKNREKIFEILETFGYNFEGLVFHSLEDICTKVLLLSFGAKSLVNYSERLNIYWERLLSKASILFTMLRVNCSLIVDSVAESFSNETENFDFGGDTFRDCREITIINAIDSIVRKEDWSIEGEKQLNELVNKVSQIDENSFYYPGALLGIATCELNLGNEKKGISILNNLIENRSNFMCSSTAARNLMIYYSRAENARDFGTAREKYLHLCSMRSLDPAVITMDDARNFAYASGHWYFVLMPFNKQYYPITETHWSSKVRI